MTRHIMRVYGPINTLKAVIFELLAKSPNNKHFELTTDTSENDFKSVSVFQRVAAIANSLQKTFLLCYFGPEYVKYLCDSAGCLWVNKYSGKCVTTLDGKATDLDIVARTMNTLNGKPSSSSSGIDSTVTIVIPSVMHTLPKWLSIPRTCNNYFYFITPEKTFWCLRMAILVWGMLSL